MHIDEGKKFDKRNIERNIKDGIITLKEFELYLSKLPDASDKIFFPEDEASDSDEFEPSTDNDVKLKKKGLKMKSNRGR